MKTTFALLALLLGLFQLVGAEAPGSSAAESAAVVKVVQQFFDAMHARDADGMRKVYQPNSQFTWGAPGAEGYSVRQQTIETFAEQAKGSPIQYLERMWEPTVHIDGRIAVVWTRYDFHRGDKFSHNGTDCYVRLKTDHDWKIVSLVFSVEPSAKTENPAGPPH